MSFLLKNQRTGGQKRFCPGSEGGVLSLVGEERWWGKGLEDEYGVNNGKENIVIITCLVYSAWILLLYATHWLLQM
jgi:hypothetical protein